MLTKVHNGTTADGWPLYYWLENPTTVDKAIFYRTIVVVAKDDLAWKSGKPISKSFKQVVRMSVPAKRWTVKAMLRVKQKALELAASRTASKTNFERVE